MSDYCAGCNGMVPGIMFMLADSEDGKVYVERCNECCLYGYHKAAATHVSTLTWWRVYMDSSKPYFLITKQEAREFVRRNQVTNERPEQDDECEDCQADDSGTCRDHCYRCENGDRCSAHDEEDA